MESLIGPGIALVIGIAVGFALGARGKDKKPKGDAAPAGENKWWEMRKTLTGTQLQILQYMEAKKSATIAGLQEKFSFIPDRELYYRLEQIVLMGFVIRGRKDSETVYKLNEEYSVTVEDDKTVMLPNE
ncbi:MAG: hypothetical protein WD002_09110 [Pseudomonadales bacterium]